MGRRRVIPEIYSNSQRDINFAERAAINSVIQGSAADLIKVAMVHIHQKIADKTSDIRLILQVHDELVFECRKTVTEKYMQMIRDEMEQAMILAVPLKVEVSWGDNWLDAK